MYIIVLECKYFIYVTKYYLCHILYVSRHASIYTYKDIYIKRLCNRLRTQNLLFALIMKQANISYINIYDAEWHRNKDLP